MLDWLTKLGRGFDQRLRPSYIRFVASIILFFSIFFIASTFFINADGRTPFGRFLGADFIAFYTAGRVFNEHGASLIYDRQLPLQLYLDVFPTWEMGLSVPYANAPFIIPLWAGLARLPYVWAYAVWVLALLALYGGGLWLVGRTLRFMPRPHWGIALLLAITFVPFVVETVVGGQLSPVAFALIALAWWLVERERPWLAGMVLAFCLYKPPLLLLLVPMLFITRQWRIIGGGALGTAVLSLVSWLLVGTEGCLNYFRALFFFADVSTTAVTPLRSWKYVDLNSFARLLAGEWVAVRWLIVLIVGGGMAYALYRVWITADLAQPTDRRFLWGITILWGTVLNVYVAIYDTPLLVLGLLLAADALYARAPSLPKPYQYTLLALYLAPWVTQIFAQKMQFQLLTPLIIGAGFYLIQAYFTPASRVGA